MSDVTIKTREDGPLLVTGPVKLTDHLGNVYDLSGSTNIALCRCGGSSQRPFCDGSHSRRGFCAGDLANGRMLPVRGAQRQLQPPPVFEHQQAQQQQQQQ